MRNKEFRECQLSTKLVTQILGLLYVEDVGLGHKVLEAKDMSTAIRTTFVPVELDIETIERDYLNLDAGRASTFAWLVRKIQEFLSAKANHIVVLENAAAWPDSPHLHEEGLTVNCFGDEVYHSLLHEDAENREFIENTIKTAESPLRLFGIMSSMPESVLPLGAALNKDTLALLAENCEHMITSAFDGTGYLICSFV